MSCSCCSSSASSSVVSSPAMSVASSSSSSSSAPSSKQTHHLYGQADLARFCAYVVSNLFASADCAHQRPPKPAQDHRSALNAPPLLDFIAYALYRTRLPLPVIQQALYLLHRLKSRFPTAKGTISSPHRLFLSSLMLAAKGSMDDCYANKSWVIVGSNLFPLREVNQMERELFAFLDYSLVIDFAGLQSFIADCHLEWALQQESDWQREHMEQQPNLRNRFSADDTLSQQDRKRRLSDSAYVLLREEALRHKRASDAAYALLLPRQQMVKRFRLRPAIASPASISSSAGSLSPCDSMSSSSSECSTPSSPLSSSSIRSPDMTEETCCSFASTTISRSCPTMLKAS